MFVLCFVDNLCLLTLLFDETDHQATLSKKKEKTSERYKEKLTQSTEDFQNSKTRKDGVSVDFQQNDLETLLMLININ